MASRNISYYVDSHTAVVWVEGNEWVKHDVNGLTVEDIGFDLNNSEQSGAFIDAGAPGGTGLESYGFERMGAYISGSNSDNGVEAPVTF